MKELVFIVRGLDGTSSKEPQACITQVPMTSRGGIYQDLTPSELSQFGDDLTAYWEAEWDGDGYDLIRLLPDHEVDEAESYRCEETEDLFQ